MDKIKIKKIPDFKNEKEERKFWSKHDVVDYFDMAKASPAIFPNLRPSTRRISIRVPETLLFRIRQIAVSKDVPYQSLMKTFLADKVREELSSFQ